MTKVRILLSVDLIAVRIEEHSQRAVQLTLDMAVPVLFAFRDNIQ